MQTAFTLIRTFSRRRSSRILFRCLPVATLVFRVLSCAGQEAAPPAQEPLRSATELVKIETTVLDRHGDFVGGMPRSSFRVVDNGVEQSIVFFAPVEAPAQVLVMLETSPAVYLIHDQHLAAAYALTEGLAPGDQVALATYEEAPQPELSFTSNKSALLAALGQVQYTIGMANLNFYDSLSTVLDWLAGIPGKRALVLLTTGLDSSPPGHWDALAQKLRGEDVVIFSVALGGDLREEPARNPKRKKSAPAVNTPDMQAAEDATAAEFAKADEALRSLAAISGGRAYFPQSQKDFPLIYHEIASALRHQYVLGIAPAHDNQFHTLAVEVLGGSSRPDPAQKKPSGYRVFARAGYVAPGP